ncbi:hypothetical membrane protein, conserved [Thermococcus kodakarensis KOD1]|uniref:Hypothetical membrane protein, conserved n=1 Tax=Thermococcus kodakarensis (strain ATCC BAA-918 / JCM 12380 / KOD1) TaxID=69014 RepID=Q5JEK2_THEKO|nr:hypothetical protein [Thermococcus kodakarensis]WCN27752.1 hypothetical protein POG15_09410 [Thermococcus kodakarensis]WCN30045.1 hypothetical protein POG21_09395 [Thermococcus kodakarensis]BAD86036.1 hypothetical membrane protein, conserved [Thermococcus kodakarensis KOD1]
MSLRELTKQYKLRIAVGLVFIAGAVLPGPYYVRWLSAVALSVFVAWMLIGYDIVIVGYDVVVDRGSGSAFRVNRRPDFERALQLVKRTKKGGGREVAEEYILEILHSITGRSFYELRTDPPKALQAFYSSKNPYEGLKEALKILEAELNED